MIRATWLGHAAVRLEWEDVVVYVDPVDLKPDKNPPADLILLTNPKPGHTSPEDVAILTSEETVVAGPPDALAAVGREGRALIAGETIEAGGASITAVPAGTKDSAFFPIDAGWLGYLIELGDRRIYVAGMTDRVPEDLAADTAFLPISGRYVMDLEAARRAGESLGARHLLPLLVMGDRYYRTEGFVTTAALNCSSGSDPD